MVMGLSRYLWRGTRFACLSAWALTMVVVGLLAMMEWPGRFPGLKIFLIVAGVVLVCAGQFVFAFAASTVCPEADARVTGLSELIPWLVAAATLVGVVVL